MIAGKVDEDRLKIWIYWGFYRILKEFHSFGFLIICIENPYYDVETGYSKYSIIKEIPCQKNTLHDAFEKFYREDLEKQGGCGVVAHERLTEPRVTIEWLLAKQNSLADLPTFRSFFL